LLREAPRAAACAARALSMGAMQVERRVGAWRLDLKREQALELARSPRPSATPPRPNATPPLLVSTACQTLASRTGSGGLSPRLSPRLPSIDEKKGDDQGFLVPPSGASHYDAAGWAVESQGYVRPLDVPPETAHGLVSAVADGGESRRAAALPDDAARLEAADRSCYHAR
jgi:hypothetical protein